MSPQEWESLCDGCGRCCLVKLEDEDTGEIHATGVACRLFDARTCRCTDYKHRHRRVKDCIRLDADSVASLSWLPASCAYRRIADGRGLAWWHPLVSGDPATVAAAGASIAGQVVNERDVDPDLLGNFIRDWPEPVD